MRCSMLSRLIFALLLIGLASCTHPGKMGDRAFEAENYSLALKYYEEEMTQGANDWNLYYRAAKAATRIGSFSTAERYYSLSLRYGGGLEVAKDLAEFYVQTSNYARAVRVYQFLLKHTDDPQPVYNNLGTALMYAGKPLDGESYLMISQQMAPKNPLPYINLGVLYDQHLKQPQLARLFFECFLELSGEEPNESTRVVTARLQEMKLHSYTAIDYEGFRCGEPYIPVQRPVRNLRSYFEGPEWQDTEHEEVIELGLESVAEPGAGTEEVLVERGGAVEAPASLPAARERAQAALAERQYDQVVQELSGYPMDKLEARDMLLLGTAFMRSGRTKDALPWLEWSMKREATPEAFEALLGVYLMLDEGERIQEFCRKYQGQAGFSAVASQCAVTKDDK